MNCSNYQGKLSPYLEGELSADEKKSLEEHLSTCTACTAELKALQEMVKGLKEVPDSLVPSDFRQGVWNRIEAASPWVLLRQRLLEPWYLKVPVGALATAAVVLLAVQVSQHTAPRMMKPAAPSEPLPPALQKGKEWEDLEKQLRPSSSPFPTPAAKDLELAYHEEKTQHQPSNEGDNKRMTDELEESRLNTGSLPAPAQAPTAVTPESTGREREMQVPGAGPPPQEMAERQKVAAARSYFHLSARDVDAVHQAVVKLIAEIPMRQIETPLPLHYELLMDPERVDLFLDRIRTLGEIEHVGEESPEGETSDQHLIVLDIIPISSP